MIVTTKVTNKDYQVLFSISKRTAVRWMAQDRAHYGVAVLTIQHVSERYCVPLSQVWAMLFPMCQ